MSLLAQQSYKQLALTGVREWHMPTNFFSSELEPESQIPERPSRREPLVIKEHETFVLTATMAAPSVAAVTWLKDGVEIRRSKRHEATSLGDTHTLTVRGAQVLDSAIYSCRVGKESQDFPVQVEGKQRLGARHLDLLQGPYVFSKD